MSPQHWAKYHQKDHCKNKGYHGTLSQTTCQDVTLLWNDRKARLTVPLAKENNVATFYLAPGFTKYYAFCAQAGLDDEVDLKDPLICHQVEDVISDENVNVDKMIGENTPWQSNQKVVHFHNDDWKDKTVGKKLTEPEGGHKYSSAELLKIHQRLGHMSFAKMKVMARKNIIPNGFRNTQISLCAACTYAKMIKKPWRNKPSLDYQKEVANNPGKVVSVDQLVSPTPGLIAQMTGHLTTQRYKYATVYVDQYSKLGYVHIQKSSSAEETVTGKRAFEKYMLSLGVRVKSYQADNGIFRAHKWMDASREQGQSISFVGVNAHHQNGHAERRIRELQDAAQTILIHASKKWPDGITTNLWPYALRMASDTFNNAPNLNHDDGLTPLQIASRSEVNCNIKHRHTFGSPVYVLESELQQNKTYSKWKDRAQVGIYLGPSPHHNRNVALVLNRKTGLVSPQFHVKHDNFFETVKEIPSVNDWKTKAGFMVQREVRQKRETPNLNNQSNPQKRGSESISNTMENKDDEYAIKRNRKNNNQNPQWNTSTPPEESLPSNDMMDKKLQEDISKGLRQSPRLNPSLGVGHKLLSLQATISSQAKDKGDIEGEILQIDINPTD